ncbi:hypothetical protein ACQJBY_059424 [Aegilops geniculata]
MLMRGGESGNQCRGAGGEESSWVTGSSVAGEGDTPRRRCLGLRRAEASGDRRRQEKLCGDALRLRPSRPLLHFRRPRPPCRASSTFLTSRSAAAADPRGGVERSWIHVKASTASVQTLEVDNATMMYSCELATRVLSLFVTLLVSPQRSSAGSASLSSTPS